LPCTFRSTTTIHYQIEANALDTSVPIGRGAHYVVVQSGDVFKTPVAINVSSTSSAATDAGSTIAQIQAMNGWDSSSVCAGCRANGPETDHGLKQRVGAPSLSRSPSAAHPGEPALWWKQVAEMTVFTICITR
jgi:hypothetical protein